MQRKVSGIAVATAAAAMFALAPVSAGAAEQVKCMGANACKGQSACKTANSSCKGQNSCKGHGFVMATKDECTKMGGEVAS
ncbi:MAG: hypothetical protein R3286_20525 [Gammaproteobacteria bacterium]|nr:hypothetical protein [Gammaproteobacteria bacterium]